MCNDGEQCKVCSNTGACTTCNTGYYANSDGDCMPCAGWCATCSSASVCTQAKQKWGVVIINGGS